MSLDMPFYEELRRRGHRAARSWLIGDCLYYIGLLMAMLAVAAGAISIVLAIVGGARWLYVLYAIALFVAGVAVFVAGSLLKGRSYRLAAQDGIHVRDY